MTKSFFQRTTGRRRDPRAATNYRRAAIEQLESRDMLAGDIVAVGLFSDTTTFTLVVEYDVVGEPASPFEVKLFGKSAPGAAPTGELGVHRVSDPADLEVGTGHQVLFTFPYKVYQAAGALDVEFEVDEPNEMNNVVVLDERVTPVLNQATQIPPEAFDDGVAGEFATDEDTLTMIAAAALTANDTDANGDPLTVVRVGADDGDPLVGQTSMGATVTLAGGQIAYDPTGSAQIQGLAVSEQVVDTFSYTISDGQGGFATAQVSVTVAGVNDGPTATDNQYITDEDTPKSGNLVSDDTGDGVDSDPDATDTVVVIAINGNPAAVGTMFVLPSGATVTVNSAGGFIYDPTTSAALNSLPVGQSDSESFTYTIEDESGASSTATVDLTIQGVNDDPTAVENAYSLDEDAQQTGNLIGDDTGEGVDSDPDSGDMLAVSEVNGESGDVGTPLVLASGATLTVNSNGAFTYDASTSVTFNALNDGETDMESFTYTVSDGNGGVSTATVTMTITGVTDVSSLTASALHAPPAVSGEDADGDLDDEEFMHLVDGIFEGDDWL